MVEDSKMEYMDETVVSDEMALNYHLMHPGGDSAPGDPNAAFFLDGTYHLHYILRHPWQGKTSYSFIHVTSPDMLHWTWQPTKLQPSFTGHGMFSGTGFITKEGQPAAIYAATAVESRGSYIVVAKNNDLSEWEKPYPVLPTGGPGGKNMSLGGDPDCFRVGERYYACSAVEGVQLCTSDNLVDWRYIGGLMKHDMPDVAIGEDISCANMYRIGEKWMLLCISHSMGCRYYLGDWDAEEEQFVPFEHRRMNWRRRGQSLIDPVYRDFFAPESVLTPDGRRLMWAWLTTLDKEIDLKSVQSLPRELSLGRDGSLRINPLRELESLRYDGVSYENIEITPSLEGNTVQKIAKIDGDSFEIRIAVDRSEAYRKRFGFVLYADDERNGIPVVIRPESASINVGETEAPFAVEDLPDDEDVEIRIFVDKYLVEVFVNGRQAALTSFLSYKDAGNGLGAYSFRGRGDPNITLRKVEIWKIKATNQGFFDARESRVWAPDVD